MQLRRGRLLENIHHHLYHRFFSRLLLLFISLTLFEFFYLFYWNFRLCLSLGKSVELFIIVLHMNMVTRLLIFGYSLIHVKNRRSAKETKKQFMDCRVIRLNYKIAKLLFSLLRIMQLHKKFFSKTALS